MAKQKRQKDSEIVNRKTDNTMAKQKRQVMVNKNTTKKTTD
jgi:hypothetical protein